jgi:hypothetical protein
MTRHIERPFVALVVCATVCVTGAQSLAIVVRAWLHPSEPVMASEISWLMIFIAVLFFAAQVFLDSKALLRWIALLLSAAGSICLFLVHGDVPVAGITLFFCALAETQAASLVMRRLPTSVDGVLRVRPIPSVLWGIVGILLLIQTGRLSAFMADDTVDWWLTTRQPLWAKHMCLPGYVEPVDLHRQGAENVYDARYYSALVRNATPHLTVRNMDAYVGDPFQYPPQFLLGPYLVMSLTSDYTLIRSVWYGVQVIAFAFVAFLLGRWLQPEAGWGPLLLVPLVWISVPAMQSFQYGQFHMAAIVLAVGGMLAFEHERHFLGGVLLATAVLAKIFPGVLLLFLAFNRKWRSLGWTVAFITLGTLLAFLVLGDKPFGAFFTYHLPRLMNGEAFAFAREWPELRNFFIADNLSPGGIAAKLQVLGIPWMTETAGSIILRVYSVLRIIVVFFAARKKGSRLQQAWLWLALLNLGALQSPGAWGDYVTLGTVWLLSLLSWQMYNGVIRIVFLAACWVFSFSVLGVQPMPELLPVPMMMVLTSIGVILLLAVNVWVMFAGQPVRIVAEGEGPGA